MARELKVCKLKFKFVAIIFKFFEKKFPHTPLKTFNMGMSGKQN